MLKHALLFCAFLSVSFCIEREERRQKYVDPFAALDKHISHSLAFHYLWPWSQIFNAAAAIDMESGLEEPQLVSNADTYQIKLQATNFKPDELKVRVKNRNIIIEGKHKETNDYHSFMTNHFVQRFALPAGSKQEEVTAVLDEQGVLVVTVPRHEVPPPPPEIEVPIEVKIPATTTAAPTTDNKESSEETTDKQTVKPVETSPEKPQEATTQKKSDTPAPVTTDAPLVQLDLLEATTHVGKIRKKELKDNSKAAKDNEVTKGVDQNGLDYALVESE